MKRLLLCFATAACVGMCGQWTAMGGCSPPVVPKESGDQVVPPAAQVRTLSDEFNDVAYYLLDRKGVIRGKWLGYPGVKAIDTAVESLLDGK